MRGRGGFFWVCWRPSQFVISKKVISFILKILQKKAIKMTCEDKQKGICRQFLAPLFFWVAFVYRTYVGR